MDLFTGRNLSATIKLPHYQTERAIARYIDGYYNPVRRHSALDYLSPTQFEKLASGWANASPLFRGKSMASMFVSRRKLPSSSWHTMR